METHEQKETDKIELANAAKLAQSLLASQTSDAVHAIQAAAEDALKVTSVQKGNDHDLLIRVDTKLDQLSGDVKSLSDGTASRIACLEADKLDIKDSYPVIYRKGIEDILTDHEFRIRHNSTKITQIVAYGAATLVIFGIIEFLLNIYFKF